MHPRQHGLAMTLWLLSYLCPLDQIEFYIY